MKKILLFILSFLFVVNVEAVNFDSQYGICEGNGDCLPLLLTLDNTYVIVPANSTIKFNAIFSDNDNINWRDHEEADQLSKIEISMSYHSDISFVSYVDDGVLFSSNENLYSLTTTSNLITYLVNRDVMENYDGGTFGSDYMPSGVINLRFPSTRSGYLNVTFTTKFYGNNNELLKKAEKKFHIATIDDEDTGLDKDYNIRNFNVTNGSIEPTYSNDVLEYSITSDNDEINLEIAPESNKTSLSLCKDNKCESLKKSKKIPLTYDVQTYSIVVESEYATNNYGLPIPDEGNGYIVCTLGAESSEACVANENHSLRKNILLTVKQNDNRSSINTLSYLKVGSSNIDFKPEITTYDIQVENNVSTIKIVSALTDNTSKYVEEFGDREVLLNEGENVVLVKVVSEKGEENTYTLNIKRALSKDSSLKEIKVNGKVLAIVDGKNHYSVIVDNEKTKVEIKLTANSDSSIVVFKNPEELKEGDNEIEITVTSSGGATSKYYLNIIRDSKISSNSNLKSLTIKGYNISFAQNILEYNLKVQDENELEIIAVAENEKATVEIKGNNNLKNESIIEIVVTAENKNETVYKINIEKESSNVLLIIVLVVVEIFAIVIVIYLIVNRKKNKKINCKNK